MALRSRFAVSFNPSQRLKARGAAEVQAALNADVNNDQIRKIINRERFSS
jgi:hypothetical protein